MIRVFYSITGKKADGQSVLIASSKVSAQEYINQHPENMRKRMWIKEVKDADNGETEKKGR